MAASPVFERAVASTGVFGFADSTLRIETNSPSILAAALATFGETHSRSAHSFAFKLFVNRQSTIRNRQSHWPQPYFRGRDHLVMAVYGGGAVLFDLLGPTRRASTRATSTTFSITR